MIRRVLLTLILVLPAPLAAQDVTQPRTHEVTAGETLWDLAARYYGNPFDWGRIFEANRGSVQNPNLILPGQQLVIPGVAGGPGEVAQVTEVAVQTPGGAQATPMQQEPGPHPGLGSRTAFYVGDVVAAEGSAGTVNYAELYWVTPDLFQSTGWIDPTSERFPEALGRISHFEAGENIRSGRLALLPFDRVHVTPSPGAEIPAVGDEVLAFRADQRIRDVGHVTVPTGILTVVGITDTTFVVELDRELGQVRLDEWIAPIEWSPLEKSDRPEILETSDMTAAIVAFQVPNQLNSMGSILHLDKGAADGVNTGDVFELRMGGGQGWTGKMVGRLIVHRVRENTASARVMQVINPVFFEGTVVERVARMN